MVRRAALPLALVAGAAAQQGTTTITYSVCPTATTTTVTLSSTITYCPGASCNVTPTSSTITSKPTYKPDGGYTSTIIDWTFTGSDGKVTELHEYVTVYPAPCPNGPGMCGATWTITEECPCSTHGPGHIPPDFTTTKHKCDRCGPSGSPTEWEFTVPCETGAYATVTPSVGPWKHPKPAGDDSEDDGDHDFWSGPKGGNGGAGGNGGNGGDANGAGAHGGNGGAGGNGGNGGNANGAGAHGGDGGAGGNGGNGGNANGGGKPVADAEGGGAPGGGAPGGGDAGGKKPVADATGADGKPVANASGAGGDGHKEGVADATAGSSSPVKPFAGSGSKTAVAVSSIFAVAVGALAIML